MRNFVSSGVSLNFICGETSDSAFALVVHFNYTGR